MKMNTHCWLCCINLQNKPKRYQSASELKTFVQSQCYETPYMFKTLLNMEIQEDTKSTWCIPCINWKRRCFVGDLSRSKKHPIYGQFKHPSVKKFPKPLLQMDQFILFLMQPGRYHVPDKRCFDRLMVAIKDPENPWRTCIPQTVQSILQLAEGDTVHDLVRAWWKYNNQTSFFRHSETARLVRAVIKYDQIEAV
jgi:hypothetical protein